MDNPVLPCRDDRTGGVSTLGGDSSLLSGTSDWNLTSPDKWKRSNHSVRLRIPNPETKSKATVRNIANAVGVLERWLVDNCSEQRLVETIPPVDLDNYLSHFYRDIKKPSGEDYDSLSFINLRSCIHRFLREKNYSSSIINGREFRNSKNAYTLRQRSLQYKAYKKTDESTVPDPNTFRFSEDYQIL